MISIKKVLIFLNKTSLPTILIKIYASKNYLMNNSKALSNIFHKEGIHTHTKAYSLKARKTNDDSSHSDIPYMYMWMNNS